MEFSTNVKHARKSKGYTLEELSEKSGVSRSMLSQIERGDKNPTINIASQIAEALGETISSLLGEEEKRSVSIIRSNERLVYKDGKTKFERHLLSPPANDVEFILNKLPSLKETGIFPPHKKGVEEYIYVAKGKLQIQLGEEPQIYTLEEGDSLYFEADVNHRFVNLSEEECNYFLIINSAKRMYR
ncbi:helix-turn-helix domain-containing protein [Priestia filamentosa]|uniref:helix-turn-helix domain-containing protein n=1 Tax=Priestia filamentosa TaxID=1402861 RepID=UPI00397B3B38